MASPRTTTDDAVAVPDGPWPSASLNDVANAAEALERARASLDDAEDEWRYAVGSAIDGGRPVEQVADAAGTTEDVAQRIHDGQA